MERLPKGSILLDVRGAEEYNVAHIEGAINIPHTKVAEKIGAVVANKSAPIFIYCRSGKRANIARESLSKLGYTNIINLGGFNDAKKSLD
jgi:phage shock protein E